ncbi:Histone-lysine N-methyltransferase, H3 lysine-4 specific [Astathelohania contejeani]|uniref:Histone-lysine N-methyltransferase, H3 lysine-4 specific n=1 Tax=Astathelohania contejeani TaxID=164912 RepID=A0ABQ7HWJ3_9MICR|nr:Histone-lysine N-methyltransferase, H3 lysine-4 specific [Thelohania contejeani]
MYQIEKTMKLNNSEDNNYKHDHYNIRIEHGNMVPDVKKRRFNKDKEIICASGMEIKVSACKFVDEYFMEEAPPKKSLYKRFEDKDLKMKSMKELKRYIYWVEELINDLMFTKIIKLRSTLINGSLDDTFISKKTHAISLGINDSMNHTLYLIIPEECKYKNKEIKSMNEFFKMVIKKKKGTIYSIENIIKLLAHGIRPICAHNTINKHIVNKQNNQKGRIKNVAQQSADTKKIDYNVKCTIKKSKIHGKGVFAEEEILAGTRFMEYIGEIIGEKMADKREKKYRAKNINSIYFFRASMDVIIDATVYGNKARFMNHSCIPNCSTEVRRSGGIPKIVIFALRNIKKGEELTLWYNMSGGEGEALKCNCGLDVCVKYI